MLQTKLPHSSGSSVLKLGTAHPSKSVLPVKIFVSPERFSHLIRSASGRKLLLRIREKLRVQIPAHKVSALTDIFTFSQSLQSNAWAVLTLQLPTISPVHYSVFIIFFDAM
jgi:hypothetical protein